MQLRRPLLTVGQVADATGLSSNAVYRAIAAGELRASKLRGRLRVRGADVDDWIDANVVAVHGPAAAPPPAARGLSELLRVK